MKDEPVRRVESSMPLATLMITAPFANRSLLAVRKARCVWQGMASMTKGAERTSGLTLALTAG